MTPEERRARNQRIIEAERNKSLVETYGPKKKEIEPKEIIQEVKTKPTKKKFKQLNSMKSSDYLELKNADVREALIDRLLPSKRLGMLVGPTKSNKTTIAYHMAQCLGEGKDFLGHKVPRKVKSLYIMSEGELTGLMNAFGYSDNVEIYQNHSIILEDYIEGIKEKVREEGIEVVFLDCLYNMTRANIAEAKQCTQITGKLHEMIEELGITIVILHHIGRSSNKEETTENNVSGSMALNNSLQFTMIIDKPQKDEDEELLTKNMTLEEYESRPVKRIIRKINYRDGGSGWDKLDVTIDFKNGFIDGSRYLTSGVRAKPIERVEDLYNYAVEMLRELPVVNNKELAKVLAAQYTDLSERSIKDKYAKEVIKKLCDNGLIKYNSKHNYSIVNK